MKIHRFSIALSLFAFAACTAAPTPTNSTADGVTASQDGGLDVGSGNRSGADSAATTQESSTAREGGGVMLGSGH